MCYLFARNVNQSTLCEEAVSRAYFRSSLLEEIQDCPKAHEADGVVKCSASDENRDK